MSAYRFTRRGRNHWHSDGRPAGFRAPTHRGWDGAKGSVPFARDRLIVRLAVRAVRANRTAARRIAPWLEGAAIPLLLLAIAAIFARALPAFVAGLAQ